VTPGLFAADAWSTRQQHRRLRGFAYSSSFEPIVGGGLFTAAAPALITAGLLPVLLLLAGAAVIFWFVVGYLPWSARAPSPSTSSV
jgi:ESS family glutamate:Na+ symporter